jgi:predicted dehydrogenase
MNRRDMIKNAGLAALGGLLAGPSAFAASADDKRNVGEVKLHYAEPETHYPPLDKPVTAIVIGANGRGYYAYANWIKHNPGRMKVVGAAEPLPGRRTRIAKDHAIPEENLFLTWEDVFKRPKFADAVIIATPDHLHLGPALAAMEKGYAILLEKPMGMNADECLQLHRKQKETGVMVGVCHVLLYAPYFRALRKLLLDGAIGKVLDIQHMEPVGHIHYSHSYVRGNWGRSATSAPFLLAKSCHDLDILSWMTPSKALRVASYGNSGYFNPENAPKEATARCLDCPLQDTCLYSAKRIYLGANGKKPVWGSQSLLDAGDMGDRERITNALKTSNYGLCVWKAGNDEPDRQVVNIEYDNGLLASFHLCIGSFGGRQTRVTGSTGMLHGDMDNLWHTDILTGKTTKVDIPSGLGGHGGGDGHLIAAFSEAVSKNDPSKLTTTLEESMQSHLMGYRAEDSRKSGGSSVNVPKV